MTTIRPFHRMNIRYTLRRERTDSQGNCPIVCRLTKNGLRTPVFSTGLSCPPEKWNAAAQRIKGASKEVHEKNRLLEGLYNQLTGIYNDYLIMGTELTPGGLLEVFKGGDSVSQIGEKHLRILQEKGRAHGTIQRYQRSYDLLEEYVGISTSIRQISKRQAHEFWSWLRAKKLTTNYCNKVQQAVKGLLDYAIRIDCLALNPFAHIRLEWDGELDTTHLTQEELDKLITLEWSDKLQRVVDAFVIMCHTGMHIGDYLTFDSTHLITITDEAGTPYRMIVQKRGKTGKLSRVPLHPEVKRIIGKYGSVEALPRISGQKMNDYLKLIAERISTPKLVTNKTGRKTFTDFCLNRYGMSYEATAGCLGHTSTRQIKHYGAIKEQRILNEWLAGQNNK
jgi:integrase/recombinase XerD